MACQLLSRIWPRKSGYRCVWKPFFPDITSDSSRSHSLCFVSPCRVSKSLTHPHMAQNHKYSQQGDWPRRNDSLGLSRSNASRKARRDSLERNSSSRNVSQVSRMTDTSWDAEPSMAGRPKQNSLRTKNERNWEREEVSEDIEREKQLQEAKEENELNWERESALEEHERNKEI